MQHGPYIINFFASALAFTAPSPADPLRVLRNFVAAVVQLGRSPFAALLVGCLAARMGDHCWEAPANGPVIEGFELVGDAEADAH